MRRSDKEATRRVRGGEVVCPRLYGGMDYGGTVT